MNEPKQLQAAKTVEKKTTRKYKKITQRQLKYGSIATTITVVFIAVVVIINVLLNIFADKVNIRLDLSKELTFTLGEDTKAFLKEMKGSAEIIIIGNEDDFRAEKSTASSISKKEFIVETTDNYKKENENISVYYIDPTYNPGFFKSRNIIIDTTTDYDVIMIVYSPETNRNRQIYSNIFSDLKYVGLERRITGGLSYVTKEDIQTVALVQGHGENTENSYLQFILKDNGFDTYLIDLSKFEDIPDYVDILVIDNPKRTYSTDDINKIDRYLSNNEKYGHHLIVLEDIDCPDNPILDEYLEEWGLRFGSEVIFDSTHSYAMENSYEPFLKLTYEPNTIFSEQLKNGSDVDVHLGKCIPVEILFKSEDGIETYTLMKSYESAFSRELNGVSVSSTNFKNFVKTDDDKAGPFPVMVLSSKTRYEGTNSFSSNIVAIGSASFTDDYYLSNIDGSKQSVGEAVVSLFKYLVSASESIETSILPKSLLPDTLSFATTTDIRIVFLGLTIGIPLVFAIIGIIVFRRRKFL